jgi:hypothetical protein
MLVSGRTSTWRVNSVAKNRAPDGVSIAGEEYKLLVALVHSKDKKGRPKLLSVLYDEQSIDLAGGEEFITFYALRRVMRGDK